MAFHEIIILHSQEGNIGKSNSKGKVIDQFIILGEKAGMKEKSIIKVFQNLTSKDDQVEDLINKSFLSDKLKRNYLQNYQRRLKKLKIVID
ncbi:MULTISPECIES: hypothetical protein [unclassified Empedobacter]|uniref:hypothetical protein n=1 Tax=unclassified Empedobacter TaxID=2643773 RepID=UPI0025C13101|nr:MULTISPECIES: hypothetical protein [unclassified Empedobacter]